MCFALVVLCAAFTACYRESDADMTDVQIGDNGGILPHRISSPLVELTTQSVIASLVSMNRGMSKAEALAKYGISKEEYDTKGREFLSK